MKKLCSVLACSLIMAFGPAAHASPEEDAAFIADALISDELQTMLFDSELRKFADRMADALAERSVKVKDDAAYLDLVSVHFAAATNTDLQALALEKLAQFSPNELAIVAQAIRDEAAGVNDVATAEPTAIEDFPAALEAAFAPEKIEEQGAILGVVLGLVPAVLEETRNAEVTLTAPYMAEILETDGVFQFPNRIVRKDLIAEVRAANP